MKKLIAGILVILIILTTAACGAGSSGDSHRKVDWEPEGTLTLALRAGTYADVIEKSVMDFEEKTHIYCEILKLGEDELASWSIGEDGAVLEGDFMGTQMKTEHMTSAWSTAHGWLSIRPAKYS